MAETYRILLADDHVLVAEGIQKLLEPEFQLVGIVADGRALVAEAAKLQPDLVVVDISLPLLNGLFEDLVLFPELQHRVFHRSHIEFG